jgi:hypothetical protein
MEDPNRQLGASRTKDEGWKKLNGSSGIAHLREVINEQE